MTRPDVAVVGAGIVGLATAVAARDLGARVRVYERALPGGGQSGGESRIFRHLHEDPRLVAFARESRALWREWEERFGVELVSADGVVALGPGAAEDARALAAAGVRARTVETGELAERLPPLARWDGPALLDEDGGVIRTSASIAALVAALGAALVQEEVLAVRPTAAGTVEVRAGGLTAEHDRMIVCAGRDTDALAAGVGLELPVQHRSHVRLAFPVAGEPPPVLACLLDRGEAFGEPSAYGDPLPGNGRYAIGLGDAPVEPGYPEALADFAERAGAYVTRALPGLVPRPAEARHCWVTALPWSHDGIAAWTAGGLTFLAGSNLFKHAPALGRALARAALGEQGTPDLRPEARLGAPV